MTHTTPLAQQVVGVAAAIREEAEAVSAHGGVVAVLHALFLSTLARLVGRLEHMILQWQAGRLPPPAPRAPRTPHPDSVHLDSAHPGPASDGADSARGLAYTPRHHSAHRPRRTPGQAPETPLPPAPRPAAPPRPRPRAPTSRRAPRRPVMAALPTASLFCDIPAPMPKHAHNITISK